jgi:tetratricopeptide (TPR) repeat protein
VTLACFFSLAVLLGATDLGDAPPAEPSELLVRANAAYDDGRYQDAAALYQEILAGDVDNGYIHYNLGNALLRAGRLGQAIAAYRRAQSLLPRDSEVHANLEFARSATKDAIEPHEPSAVLRTLFFWYFSLSQRELLFLLCLVNALFWGALLVRLFARQSEILRWILALLLVVLLITGGSTALRLLAPSRIAIIGNYEVDVRSGISKDTVVRFKLHEGTEVRALDEQEGWVRIALPDGKQGWVEREQLLIVTL